MTENSGLNLEQVRSQWQESQRLLESVRQRLEVLQSVSESAEKSATSISASEQNLKALVDVHVAAIDSVQKAQKVAAEALEKIATAVQASDMGFIKLSLDRASTASAGIQSKVDQVATRTDEVMRELEAMKLLLGRVSVLEDQLAVVTSERDRARGDLATAIAMLPGRFAGKIQSAIGK